MAATSFFEFGLPFPPWMAYSLGKMKFTAIDVETANADLASICQIGVAKFVDGRLTEQWVTLVDPEDYFDGINISIHGITESMVAGQPTFREISSKLHEHLTDGVVVSHTHFDRAAIRSAHAKSNLQLPETLWIDSAKVVRRTWPQFSSSGYGLASVANFLGISFGHHDAGEDARAAGEILIQAMEFSGVPLDQWPKRSSQPIDLSSSSITRDGNPDGALFGEKIVFTGSLGMLRREAADLAARAGCEVLDGVTKKTTLLVVGDQDVAKLNGQSKSSKHRKAEDLIHSGISIRILRESDFIAMVAD
jgi:DNA polymerase III subunit epsilon